MIVKQYNILVIDNDKIVGLMSFIHNFKEHKYFKIDKYDMINNYITTICVNKDYRNRKIATILYDYIENNLPQEINSEYISTRTWSTNLSHINLLKRRNYENTYRIKNDRMINDTTKVDTIYFLKHIK